MGARIARRQCGPRPTASARRCGERAASCATPWLRPSASWWRSFGRVRKMTTRLSCARAAVRAWAGASWSSTGGSPCCIAWAIRNMRISWLSASRISMRCRGAARCGRRATSTRCSESCSSGGWARCAAARTPRGSSAASRMGARCREGAPIYWNTAPTRPTRSPSAEASGRRPSLGASMSRGRAGGRPCSISATRATMRRMSSSASCCW